MADTGSDAGPRRSEGLIGSLRRVVQTLAEVLDTRLGILSTEIAEERLNLTRLILVALAALFFLQIGVFLAVLFVVLAVSDANRLAAIGIAAAVLLLLAVGGALWLRHWLRTRPPMFATTIAELRKDRDRMKGGHEPGA
jgi:uncharacterized membrane protein YqjE